MNTAKIALVGELLALVVPFMAQETDEAYNTPGCMDDPFTWEAELMGYSASPATFKPSSWYFRHELRNARTLGEKEEIGMQAILEIESLKDFIRSHGLIPPKTFIMAREALEKGLKFHKSL